MPNIRGEEVNKIILATFLIGCTTPKPQLPDDCTYEGNWHMLEFCKSKDKICFEALDGVDCIERWEDE